MERKIVEEVYNSFKEDGEFFAVNQALMPSRLRDFKVWSRETVERIAMFVIERSPFAARNWAEDYKDWNYLQYSPDLPEKLRADDLSEEILKRVDSTSD